MQIKFYNSISSSSIISSPRNHPHTNYSRERSIAINPRFKSSIKYIKITGCFSDKKQLVDYGIFNMVNMHAYHYTGNNPVKYVDPDGRMAN